VDASSTLTGLGQADDSGEQSTYGIWEILTTQSGITNGTDANAAAAAILAKALVGRKKIVRYTTNTAGLAVGQLQTITLPSRNLSGSFLITAITAREASTESKSHVAYDVTAVEGSDFKPGWEARWREVFT
jgi:hypothetical protein